MLIKQIRLLFFIFDLPESSLAVACFGEAERQWSGGDWLADCVIRLSQ